MITLDEDVYEDVKPFVKKVNEAQVLANEVEVEAFETARKLLAEAMESRTEETSDAAEVRESKDASEMLLLHQNKV